MPRPPRRQPRVIVSYSGIPAGPLSVEEVAWQREHNPHWSDHYLDAALAAALASPPPVHPVPGPPVTEDPTHV